MNDQNNDVQSPDEPYKVDQAVETSEQPEPAEAPTQAEPDAVEVSPEPQGADDN